MSLACLDSLIGLSATSHDCFTDTEPSGFDTSSSGYYLTDPDFGLTAMDGVAVAGWGVLTQAREQAIREFKNDLLASLRSKYDLAVHPFSGYFGKLKYTGIKSANSDFLGLRIRSKRQKGMKVILTKCLLGLDTSGTYTVSITSNDPLFVAPDDLAVTHVTGSFNGTEWPDSGIELPLWSDSLDCDYLEYYVSFDRDGAKPYNNLTTCCGNVEGWKSHVSISGFEANSQTPETSGSFSTSAMGMSLKGYITCETLDWICELNEIGGLDFQDLIARCIQERGAAIACSLLIESPGISVGNGFNLPILSDRRQFLNGKYAANVKWISENIPRGVTDCFKCKPSNQFHKTKLLV
jgi:hypothetical protein